MPALAYLCSDLLFTSKIRETAAQLGWQARVARDPAALAAAAKDAGCVIVDLRRPDALLALAALRDDVTTADIPSVGFCDHERLDRMAEARAAGCTHVLAKGRFSADLKALLGPGAPVAAPPGA